MRSRQNLVFFAVTVDLQRTQEVDEIPGVVRLDHVSERRHGRAVHAGHEDLVDILVGVAALEARVTLARGEVVGTNRQIFAVGESRGRWTVALPVRTVTLPAFELGEERFAVGNALEVTGGSAGILIGSPAFSFSQRGEKILI